MNFRYAAMAALAFAAAGTMSAITAGPQNYTYDLTLPTIANGVEVDSTTFDFQFSWGPGPLKFDAADNTSCPLGCPVNGTTPGTPAPDYSYSGMFFTASTAEGCATAAPADGCAEVVIPFTDSLGDTITFTLIEPDSFWAAGGAATFGQGDGSGIGASWVQSLAGADADDPPCTSCSVFTTLSAANVATPEPASWLLLAGSLAFFGVALGLRKLRKA